MPSTPSPDDSNTGAADHDRDRDSALDAYLATAVQAAREAAAIQLAERGSDLQVSTKSSAVDLVTRVDKLCEERIRHVILARHPGHAILGEEQGDGEADELLGTGDGAEDEPETALLGGDLLGEDA